MREDSKTSSELHKSYSIQNIITQTTVTYDKKTAKNVANSLERLQ